MIIKVQPAAVFRKLLLVFAILLVLDLLAVISRFVFNHDTVLGLVPLFDFNAEQNIPTLYSTLLLLSSSVLLSGIARYKKLGGCTYLDWAFLSVIFLLLGLDEFICLHERFNTPVKNLIPTSGYFHFAWVIPYGILTLIIALGMIRLLIRLPAKIRVFFMLSGFVYLSGALGFEMLGSREAYIKGGENLMYALLYSVEESLEVLGLSFFLFSLLKYIDTEMGQMTLSLHISGR